MGNDFLKAMTLKLYKAKIKDLVGTTDFGGYITGETTKDRTLIIYCKEPWKSELHARRYQIQKAINNRLENEYLNEVRIK